MEKDIIKSRLKIPFFVNESNEQRPIYICSNHRNFILSNHNSDCCSICGKHSSVQPTNGQSIYTNYNENVSPLKLSYRYVSIFSKQNTWNLFHKTYYHCSNYNLSIYLYSIENHQRTTMQLEIFCPLDHRYARRVTRISSKI